MKDRILIVAAAVSGFTAVALGAFGAHGLRNTISPGMLEVYKTGILYHLVHSAVLLSLALSGKPYFRNAFHFILAGIFLFSFSLYFYALTGVRFLALITPFGGVSFLTGWIIVAVQGYKHRKIKD